MPDEDVDHGSPSDPVAGHGECNEPACPHSRRVVRLEKRARRERAARQEAEEIAEKGMRQLWLANRELDRRVEERTAELERTLGELREAASARDHLLTNISHEVKTPMNGIIGALDLLSDHVEGAEPMGYLAAARVSADRLHNLLSQLLVKVETLSGRLRLEPGPTVLSDLVEEVRRAWEIKAMKLGYLVLVVDASTGDDHKMGHVGDVLIIDRKRVIQIVDGFIETVIRCSTASVVTVELHHDDDLLSIELSVPAAGLDLAAVESHGAGWIGNGLAQARQLVWALGGRLTAGLSDTEPRTFRFKVEVPATAETDPAVPSRSMTETDERPHRTSDVGV